MKPAACPKVTLPVPSLWRARSPSFPGDRCRQSVYLDDRSWITVTAQTCIEVARAQREEIRRLCLAENLSKAEFSCTEGVQKLRDLSSSIPPEEGQVVDRPKLLGARVQMTRAHDGAHKDEEARLNAAAKTMRMASKLPVSNSKKLYYATAAGMARQQPTGAAGSQT